MTVTVFGMKMATNTKRIAVADTTISWVRLDILPLMMLLVRRPTSISSQVDGRYRSADGSAVDQNACSVGGAVRQIENQCAGMPISTPT